MGEMVRGFEKGGPSPGSMVKGDLGEFSRVFDPGQGHISIYCHSCKPRHCVMNTHGELCDLTACNPCVACWARQWLSPSPPGADKGGVRPFYPEKRRLGAICRQGLTSRHSA
jgi:hypothetical protein